MKILYVNAMGPTEKTPQGGIFVTRRIESLKDLGVDVLPVSLYMDYSVLVRNLLQIKGIQYSDKPMENQATVQYRLLRVPCNLFEMLITKIYPRYYTQKIYRRLQDLQMELNNIDLIHLHWLWPAGLAVTKISQLYNIPYVITCHGSEINVGMTESRLQPLFIEVLEKAAFVEFVSQALLDKAVELGYSAHNAKVIYNGIDTDIFKMKSRCDNNRRKRVGFVGNLIPIKGADRIPDIFRAIYETLDEKVEFVVVGQGVLLEQMKAQTADLPIRFTGQLASQTLSEEYNNMDVLVVPSRSEGFPCVIKEAQACGVIVVGNAIGGIPEAIGVHGILVHAENEGDLIKKIADSSISVLRSREKYAVSQMVKAATEFSWVNQQNKTLQLYKQILDSK